MVYKWLSFSGEKWYQEMYLVGFSDFTTPEKTSLNSASRKKTLVETISRQIKKAIQARSSDPKY